MLSRVCSRVRYGADRPAAEVCGLGGLEPEPGGGAGGGPAGIDLYNGSCSRYGSRRNDQWNAAGLYGLFCCQVTEPAAPVVGSWMAFLMQLDGMTPLLSW